MFLDTSGLLCLHNDSEPNHARAWKVLPTAVVRLTHSYVISEFIALCIRRGLMSKPALNFVDEMEAGLTVDVVYVDESLHHDGLNLLRNRLDKSWSLCDAVSFTPMHQHNLTEALTTDRHSEQAGFVRLLKS